MNVLLEKFKQADCSISLQRLVFNVYSTLSNKILLTLCPSPVYSGCIFAANSLLYNLMMAIPGDLWLFVMQAKNWVSRTQGTTIHIPLFSYIQVTLYVD